MAKITSIPEFRVSPETSPAPSRAGSTVSSPNRDHLQTTVGDDAEDTFVCSPHASSSRASSASGSNSRSASPTPRSPASAASIASPTPPRPNSDAATARLTATEKGKGRAVDAPRTPEGAEAQEPVSEGPTKSQLEELMDGLHTQLVGAWHAAVAVFTYVTTTLSALRASTYEKLSQGYGVVKDGLSRAKRTSADLATAQLRRLQGYATVDVEVPTSTYGRVKAWTKARTRGACAYLLNKLHGAPKDVAADPKLDGKAEASGGGSSDKVDELPATPAG